MSELPYDDIGSHFDSKDAAAGLDALLAGLRAGTDHHAHFRALLLKKRHELGLPLINPGDLAGSDGSARKLYEEYVEQACRETGQRFLRDGSIFQAWRYFRTIGDKGPVRQALEHLDPAAAADEAISVAIEQGVHPRRGFELLLQRHGLCRAITLFDQDFSGDLCDRQHAAALLARALYKELVVAVRRQIFERFNELPPETDLVELIRHRPWLFENGNTHADPQHVAAVARIGLITEARPDQIMTLAIAEYGRLLGPRHAPPPSAPFESGFSDYAMYMRALLGQDVHATASYFRFKLAQIDLSATGTFPAEMVVLLLWRAGERTDALEVWQQYLSDQPPELPGRVTPPFYELCIQAGEFKRLQDAARAHHDSSAWAAARLMETREAMPASAPTPEITPTPEPAHVPEPEPAPVPVERPPEASDDWS